MASAAKKKSAPKKPVAKAKPAPKSKKPANDAKRVNGIAALQVQPILAKDLVPWAGNVRQGADADGTLDQLKASILEFGVLTSLVVRAKGPKFEVLAGGRRWDALFSLDAAGKIDFDTYPVPCRVVDCTDEQARDISLSENMVREQLNPFDLARALQASLEKDPDIEKAAARFGISATVARKRAALAGVCKKVEEKYLDGTLGLSEVLAFTVTDDQKAQERVLKNFDFKFGTSADIRAALTDGQVTADDRRVRFVTLARYEKAGGTVRPDLFPEDENHVYLLDPGKLDELVQSDLQEVADAIKAEGWNWVRIFAGRLAHSEMGDFTVVQPVEKKSNQADVKAMNKLEADLKKIIAGEDLEWPSPANLIAHLQQIKAPKLIWPGEVLKNGGVAIGINIDGTLEILRGMVDKKTARKLEKEEKKKAAKAEDDDAPGDDAGNDKEDEAGEEKISASLLLDLSTHRSAALSALMAEAGNHTAALSSLAYTLALPILYNEGVTSHQITVKGAYDRLGDAAGPFKGFNDLLKAKAYWLDQTPESEAEFFKWCLAANLGQLHALLAFCAAWTFSDISESGASNVHAQFLAQHLKLNMARSFHPTVENLFGKLRTTYLRQVIAEARGTELTPAELKLKKDGLAQLAARECAEAAKAGRPWLPQVLRTPEAPKS